MKKIFTLSLILISQLTFAEVLPRLEGNKVAKTVSDSLNSSDLICESSMEGKGPASSINWDNILSYHYPHQVKTVTVSNTQPAINIEITDSLGGVILDITTNTDDTSIRKLEAVWFDFSSEYKNVGTLSAPRYEVVVGKKILGYVICK